MSEQLDLFAPPPPERWWLGEGATAQKERAGWEARLLSDLAAGPLVFPFPGFTGAVCERLVAKGLAGREGAGFMGPPRTIGDMAPKDRKWWAQQEPHPQFRYALTDAGRAILAALSGRSEATITDDAVLEGEARNEGISQ